jgi:tryptophanyl-tRNA synthetase
MKRIGMTVAALSMAGGMLLAPSVGHACEGHRKAATTQASTPEVKKDNAATQARPAQSPLQEVDELLSAKCQCGSKADCTCKKGQCECSKCKSGVRQVMDAVREQKPELKLEDARYDASAGVFI